jgi:hypothetical protein
MDPKLIQKTCQIQTHRSDLAQGPYSSKPSKKKNKNDDAFLGKAKAKSEAMLAPRFSFFGAGDGQDDSSKTELRPTLKLQTDKEVYRPGDPVVVTVEISNPRASDDELACSLLLERLGFEIKGVEKLDSQWFATPKPLPGSKQRRGSYSKCELYFFG